MGEGLSDMRAGNTAARVEDANPGTRRIGIISPPVYGFACVNGALANGGKKCRDGDGTGSNELDIGGALLQK